MGSGDSTFNLSVKRTFFDQCSRSREFIYVDTCVRIGSLHCATFLNYNLNFARKERGRVGSLSVPKQPVQVAVHRAAADSLSRLEEAGS